MEREHWHIGETTFDTQSLYLRHMISNASEYWYWAEPKSSSWCLHRNFIIHNFFGDVNIWFLLLHTVTLFLVASWQYSSRELQFSLKMGFLLVSSKVRINAWSLLFHESVLYWIFVETRLMFTFSLKIRPLIYI